MFKLSSFKILGVIALIVAIMLSMGACKGKDGSSDESSKTSASNLKGYDKTIADLEKTFDDWIALTKRVTAGDTAAAIQLQNNTFTQDFTRIAMELEDAKDKGQLSEAQIQRIESLEEKFQQAFGM